MPRQYTRVPLADRFWPKVARIDDLQSCWDWTASTQAHGYGQIWSGDERRYAVCASIIAWELASGERVPDGLDVCHTCDRPICVRNDGEGIYVVNGIEYQRRGHLYVAPDLGNMKDASDKGRLRNPAIYQPERLQRGEGRYNAKMTADTVREIRRMRAAGQQRSLIAATLSIHISAVDNVLSGKRWKHVI